MEAGEGPEAHRLHACPELWLIHGQQGHVALHPDGQNSGHVLAIVTPPLHPDLCTQPVAPARHTLAMLSVGMPGRQACGSLAEIVARPKAGLPEQVVCLLTGLAGFVTAQE